MSEKKFSPEDVLKILRVCNSDAGCTGCPLRGIPCGDVGESDGYADGLPVYDVWRCDECGYTIADGTDDPDLLPAFCPNCGSNMDGDADG